MFLEKMVVLEQTTWYGEIGATGQKMIPITKICNTETLILNLFFKVTTISCTSTDISTKHNKSFNVSTTFGQETEMTPFMLETGGKKDMDGVDKVTIPSTFQTISETQNIMEASATML